DSIRVSKAVDHLVVDCTVSFADTLSAAPLPDSRNRDARFAFSGAARRHLCALDGAAPAPCTSPAVYTGLAEGVHRFALYALDGEDKRRGGLLYDWRIDSVPPATPTLDWLEASPGRTRHE